MTDSGQRTEPPTQRKIERARREGQFPSSREFVGALQFLAFALVLGVSGAAWSWSLGRLIRRSIGKAFEPDLGYTGLVSFTGELLARTLVLLAPAGALLVAVALAAQLGVTRLGLSFKKVAPDFKRLSPLSRLRELPRQNLPALLRALVLLPLFGAAVWMIVSDRLGSYLVLPLQGVSFGVRQVAASLQDLIWKAAGVFLILGGLDLYRQRQRYRRDLRMTKQEVRDEIKELEGNPQIKMRVRQIQRERRRRQMMRQVPQATAVIVNPTHYAVALRYVMSSMAAPVVVAKGKNYLAQRIRQLALTSQVPIIENPPLAQALYRSVEVGQEIPPHLYRAVAEILAYIHRLMKGRLPG